MVAGTNASVPGGAADFRRWRFRAAGARRYQRDTYLDLVVQRPQREIVVFFGNGRGQFSPAPGGPVAIGNVEPAATALGDVVADDQPDLVVAFRDKNNEYLQVFRGDGHGRFGPGGTKRYPVVTLRPKSSFWTFEAGDIDGDGHLDLVTTFDPGAASARVEIRKGLGNGRFQEPSAGVDVRAGARIAAVADLNADRRPDVVLSHIDTGWMSILLNDGKGSLALAPQSPRDLGLQAFGVAVADVNRDRRPDIVATTVNSAYQPAVGDQL